MGKGGNLEALGLGAAISRPKGHPRGMLGLDVVSIQLQLVVVIDMESGQRFIIRCEAAIPLPALVHVLS